VLFNSLEFLLFLPIVFILYWFLFNKNLKWQNALILSASYIFYGWWSYKFLLLLLLSTCLDYFYGFAVAQTNRKKSKVFVTLSVINNLGILGVFKYYNFFATEFKHVFSLIGIETNPVLLQVALPIGISFYTFHGMSYVFDIYRGRQKPVKNIIDYAVFVSFFPLLVAGPIERANHLLPQVQQKRVFNYNQALQGCRLILWGMFKKVVIADGLAGIVNDTFSNYSSYDSMALLIGALSFSIQIYGDFSGYSDIALGTSKLFGFELLSNFRFPYFSRNSAEFWRRWHISLSSWFKDYLYIPLGGSKHGKLMAVRNTMIIFIVSGFWHGAKWNFIIWGFIHACGFLPLLLLNRNRLHVSTVVAHDEKYPTLKELSQIIVTFMFVTFAWIFFRANTLYEAGEYIKLLNPFYNTNNTIDTTLKNTLLFLLYSIPLLLGDWYLRRDERVLRVPKNRVIRYLIYFILAYLCVAMMNDKSTFIYFQF